LSDFDFSSDDSSSSEEDEKVKCKKGDFTGLCIMTKGGSSRNVSDSDSDVSEDLSFESLCLKVAVLECFAQPRQVALQGFPWKQEVES
jgi:hypothetical protein